jgi:hypothetical protein
VLRVFVFRPVGLETALDATLRDELLPEFLEHSGLLDLFVGRHDEGEGDERVVASVWKSHERMTAELGEASLVAPFRPEQAGVIRDGRLEALPLAASVRVPEAGAPAILRIFRGQIREGELDLYVEEARAGAVADAEANEGLIALYLGVDRPSGFVTVSAWTHWAAIERATGGNLRQPLATRNPKRIAAGSVDHYEILPGTARPRARSEADEATGLKGGRA